MNQEPNKESYYSEHDRRPLKGLTEEDLEALRIELQRTSRETNRLYQVYLDELTNRYVDRLGH